MKLTGPDAKHFYDLMWPLHFYVNLKLKIYPDIKTVKAFADLSTEEKYDVRTALYENADLIDDFIRENPQALSKEDLAVVSGWKNFVQGDFYIERFLKKYTIFIQGDDVYAVLGIRDAFEDIVHRSYLPLYIKTVLLPFKGKIIYDGLFQRYNVYFGGGIKRDLKETYMAAKQNRRIIETLEPERLKTEKTKPDQLLKDWTPELDELAVKAKRLRGSKNSPAIYSPAFSMVKASIEFAQTVTSQSKDPDLYEASYKKMNRALKKILTTLRREEF